MKRVCEECDREAGMASRLGFLLARFLLAVVATAAALYSAAPVQAAPPAQTVIHEDEIIYIDSAGYIRVIDPRQPPGHPEVRWSSPTGGWRDLALGDINADGDDEIIAIGDNNVLAVYDPVVATGPVDPENGAGGIFWEKLYETVLPGKPDLIATGAFETLSAGAEIVVVFEDQGTSPPQRRLQILYDPVNDPDGRTWNILTEMVAEDTWTDLAAGNLDGAGVDELVLVDEEHGKLAVYRRETNNLLNPFYVNTSESKRWSDAKVGQVDTAQSLPELVAIRNAEPPLASLVVQRFSGGDNFKDVHLKDYDPAPRFVWLADVTGNGQQEIFMLRDVGSTGGIRPRLVGRGIGVDSAFRLELPLDPDNGYRYGAGGDLDGDGKDEIAILRDSKINIFYDPESSAISTTVEALTNGRTIQMGNLDAIGHARQDSLAASRGEINETLAAGTRGGPYTVQLANGNNPETAIPFFVRLDPPVAAISVNASSDRTPATLSVTLDATELLPKGVYGANIVVYTPRTDVANSPLEIPVIINVTDGIAARPAQTNLLFTPCRVGEPAPPVTSTLEILGTQGSTFDVQIIGSGSGAQATTVGKEGAQTAIEWPSNVPWVTSVTSNSNTVPGTVELTIDPGALPDPFNSATIVINGVVQGNAITPRQLELTAACAASARYLPILSR
ncbi:MAG: hypothetical protein H3C34_11260 [Caldilineaceae bacterium]|nr:hypothetical protein [Caldilineaceae bacterium]